MVIKNSEDDLYTRSNIDTLINVFNELIKLSEKKQQVILESNWEELGALSKQQQEASGFLDSAINALQKTAGCIDRTVMAKRSDLRKMIEIYSDQESLNARLLDDQLYIARKKVEHYLDKPANKTTYTANHHKATIFTHDRPIILNEFV